MNGGWARPLTAAAIAIVVSTLCAWGISSAVVGQRGQGQEQTVSDTAAVSGTDGAAGSDGKDGAVGAVGPAGSVGADGIRGAAGAQGPIGPQGQPGPEGQPGANGANAVTLGVSVSNKHELTDFTVPVGRWLLTATMIMRTGGGYGTALQCDLKQSGGSFGQFALTKGDFYQGSSLGILTMPYNYAVVVNQTAATTYAISCPVGDSSWALVDTLTLTAQAIAP